MREVKSRKYLQNNYILFLYKPLFVEEFRSYSKLETLDRNVSYNYYQSSRAARQFSFAWWRENRLYAPIIFLHFILIYVYEAKFPQQVLH